MPVAVNRSVRIIQPKIMSPTFDIQVFPARKRVAAYARVSTDSVEQQTSYEAQVSYYSNHIQDNPDWDFAGVYTDEGISGTSLKNREGFKRMMCDAMNGKINLILTKSVSRFARNTVDALTTVRQLKEKGVEVYFEKENIYTLDSKGELFITIMSSLAQEESRSISENITWGQRKRFASGKVTMPYKNFLGYEKGPDGLPKVVESEAKVIRKIYSLFLEGKTSGGIARYLTNDNILTPAGKQKWNTSTILSILTNEKYKGDAVLQKKFTVDFLSKKMKINEGEVPQYYVENNHKAIIDPKVHDMVQTEMRHRKEKGAHYSGLSPFSSKIICNECGSFFGSKVWHSNDQYRRVIWQCNHKYKNNKRCKTLHLDEQTIKSAFIDVLDRLVADREKIIADLELVIESLADTSKLNSKREKLEAAVAVLAETLCRFVSENAVVAIDQGSYRNQYDANIIEYAVMQEKLAKVDAEISESLEKRNILRQYIDSLREQPTHITEFDEKTWNTLMNSIMVDSIGRIVFQFKDGSKKIG